MIDNLKNIVVSNNLQKDILHDLGGVPLKIIDAAQNGSKREFPCPKCGGNTRFRVLDLEHGSIYCSHCCRNKDEGSGDIIGAVKWGQGLANAGDAARMVEKWLFNRDYISDAPRKKLTMDGRDMTTRRQDDTVHASSALNITAQNVEYSEHTEHFTGKVIKTTYFHRYNPRTNFVSTLKRDDLDAPKPDNKKPVWLATEKDENKKTIYAPYIAGGATTTAEMPTSDLGRLWGDVYHASRLYIVEGEKCADSFKKALVSCDFKGEVLTLGSAGQAQFWGDSSQDWANWARFISKHNATAEIWIFGDNDAPGRDAVKTTAAAFHAAGFKSIMLMDMKLRPDGNPAPEKYDIADWLDETPPTSLKADINRLFDTACKYDPLQAEHKNQVFETLEMTASGVKYQKQRNETEPLTAADLRNICVERQRARLEKETAEKNRLALNQIDVDELNAAFPIDAAPKVIKDIAVKLATQKLPYAATVQTVLAILGGVLGAHKTSYIYDNKPIYPLLHSILIGAKGTGKTTIVQTFLGPIEREFDARWAEYWEDEKIKLPMIEAEKKKVDAELETAPKNEKLLQEKRKLEARQYVINMGGPRIVISAESSFEALWLQASIDKKAAFFEGKKPIGKIYAMGDASGLLKPGRSAPNNQTTSEYWARATKVMDGDEKPKLTATDWTRGVAKGYPVLLLDSQPESAYFIDDPDLLSKGFDRRLLWSFIPQRPREKKKIKIDLKAEQDALIKLTSRILMYQGGDIVCGYETEYAAWYDGKVDLINKAQNDGDAELEAFISTLVDVTVHKIALILHVINHVESGGVPDTIDAETFKNAERLADAFLDARNLTWRQMRIAVDAAKRKGLKSKRGGDETATPFADLNRKTQDIYNLIRKVGEKQDCDRAASITLINKTKGGNPYRSESKRMAIDAELFAAGFMYIDPDNNKRVALPIYTIDDFSGEMIETPETNETPQEAPLDSAPNADVSFNGIDETPRQNREKEKTFSESDQYAPAGPYDDDVPF